MNDRIQIWLALSISFKEGARINLSFNGAHDEQHDTIAVKCMEFGACGTEIKGQTLIAYFEENDWEDTFVAKIKSFCSGLVKIGELIEVPDLTLKEITYDDWAENWKLHFKPVETGERLLVVPPWEKVSPGSKRLSIVIDPGMAFGTGSHFSTQIALELLEKHIVTGMSVCDAGTGSGIIAIAAALLGAQRILGFDNDPEAVEAAQANCNRNGVSGSVTTVLCDLAAMPGNLFDIFVANLNRTLLVKYAQKIAGIVQCDGIIIASGLVSRDESRVKDAFAAVSCRFVEKIRHDAWIGLSFTAHNGKRSSL
jgi:ribosomal protein L11 methyltransferase